MKGTRIGLRALARKAVATCMAACLAVAYVPGLAYAAELLPQDATTTAGEVTVDGWTLTYEATADDEGTCEAAITGASGYDSSAGDGSLSIPSTLSVGGTSYTVTEIGENAFYNDDAGTYNPYAASLTSVTIPNTVTTLGDWAFRKCAALESVTFEADSVLEAISSRAFMSCSALESVSLPASVAYVDQYAFRSCTALTSVTFEAETMEYLGFQAFRGCTALTSVVIPPLTGGSETYRRTGSLGSVDSFRLGYQCFYGCSALESATLLPGTSGTSYISQSNTGLFEGVADDFKLFICVSGMTERDGHASNGSGVANVSSRYYALSFYATSEESSEDTYGLSAAYQAFYASGTLVTDVLSGDAEPYAVTDYSGSETMPELEEGYTWAPSDTDLVSSSASIGDCEHFYATEADLSNAYVYIPSATTVTGQFSGQDQTSTNATVYLIDGMQDLSEVTVYLLDGTEVDPSYYTLYYELVGTDSDGNTTYTTMDPEEAWEEGSYIAYAVGAVGTSYLGSYTANTSFNVTQLTLTASSTFTGTTRSTVLGTIELQTENALSTNASFTVVADADNPQQVLLASWLAGAAGGLAIFTEGKDTDDKVWSAISGAGTSKVYVVGGQDGVGSYVMNYLESTLSKSVSSLKTSDVTDAAALANAVYEGMQTAADKYDYEWGDVAIVTSGTLGLASAAISGYAYQAAAPVFFTDADGSVSSDTLANLGDGSFSQVIVVGPDAYVSASALASIESATGLEATRVGDADNAYEASVDIQELCNETFVDDDGDTRIDDRAVIIASAREASYVAAAEQFAAACGCECVVVSSSADLKASVARCSANNASEAYLVGDFTNINAALAASAKTSAASLLAATYDEPATQAATGDTFELEGIVYTLGSGTAVELAELLEGGIGEATLGSVTYEGATYTYTAVPASLFAGATRLASVSGTVTSIGASAFQGCTALASVSLPSVTSIGKKAFYGCKALKSISTKATSIGASAFQGCSVLTSATLSATGLKSIPASAFQGCSKLASVSIASTALTSVGSKAFYGCKKLSSISLKSAKLTSIGASAFQGCSAMTKATLSSKKLKSIPASCFSGCSKLATVSIASTALTSVGGRAFYGCKKLKSVSLKSKKLKTIGASAFQGCSAMTTLTVSSTALTKVGAKAFYGCKKLKTLTLKSKKLKSVGKNALKGTTKKLTVKVPKAKVKKYTKLLQKKGLNKKAKVKAA